MRGVLFHARGRKLCGFEGGVSTVQFVQPDGRPRAYQAKYRAGQLLEEETLDEQGRPMRALGPGPLHPVGEPSQTGRTGIGSDRVHCQPRMLLASA